MMPHNLDIPTVYIGPGEMYFSDKPTRIITVLGSCLSLTMFSPIYRVGAMNHGFLPKCSCTKNCNNKRARCIKGNNYKIRCNNRLRFVDCSIYHMLVNFKHLGIHPNEIEVKMFGGANSIQDIDKITAKLSVGEQNIKKALEIIKAENLKLVTSRVGGKNGLKIIFYTHTGETFLKKIHKNNDTW